MWVLNEIIIKIYNESLKKIVGAVWELPAKQHSHSSPFQRLFSYFQHNFFILFNEEPTNHTIALDWTIGLDPLFKVETAMPPSFWSLIFLAVVSVEGVFHHGHSFLKTIHH